MSLPVIPIILLYLFWVSSYSSSSSYPSPHLLSHAPAHSNPMLLPPPFASAFLWDEVCPISWGPWDPAIYIMSHPSQDLPTLLRRRKVFVVWHEIQCFLYIFARPCSESVVMPGPLARVCGLCCRWSYVLIVDPFKYSILCDT